MRSAEGEIQLMHALFRGDRNVLFLLRPIEHNLLFFRAQLVPRHVRAHAKFANNIGLDIKAKHLPGHNRTLINGLRRTRDERCIIDAAHRARALTLWTRTGGVKR